MDWKLVRFKSTQPSGSRLVTLRSLIKMYLAATLGIHFFELDLADKISRILIWINRHFLQRFCREKKRHLRPRERREADLKSCNNGSGNPHASLLLSNSYYGALATLSCAGCFNSGLLNTRAGTSPHWPFGSAIRAYWVWYRGKLNVLVNEMWCKTLNTCPMSFK